MGPAALHLPVILHNVKNKYSDVQTRCSLYGEKAKAALGLERQIQEADRVIRNFESTLAQEALIPAGPGALQERVSELQVRAWWTPGGRGHSPNKHSEAGGR